MGFLEKRRASKAEQKKRARAEEFRRMLAQAVPGRWHTNYPLNVLDALGVRKGDTFLDVGSGPGIHTVAAWLRGARAMGVDVTAGNVLLGRKLATEVAGKPRRERRKFLSELSGLESDYLSGRGTGRLLRPAKLGPVLKRKTRVQRMQDIWENTKPRAVSHVEFMPASGHAIPVESSSVDRILSLDVLHWLHSSKAREKMLKEILRVAKPGARIMITSDPYPYGKKKAISAADHFRRIAEESGAEVSLLPGKIPTYRLVSKPTEKGKFSIRKIISLARRNYRR